MDTAKDNFIKIIGITEQVVQEHIKTDKAFTSVDIANAVKRKGVWIRNSHVAKYLRDNFTHVVNFCNADYTITPITVVVDSYGKTSVANLYHPRSFDLDDYVNISQSALTPDDVKAISNHPAPIPPPVPVFVPTSPTAAASIPAPLPNILNVFKWFK